MHKRVIIYIRVSTTEQALDGYSISAQERILREYCRVHDFEVVAIYRDEGRSGKDIKHRPELQLALEMVKRREADTFLVWKLTRFTRSLSDLCAMCDMLEEHGVAFVSHSESFDCSTPSGRMMRNILGTIAQWEREVISENVKLAMAERASQGKCTCAYVLGYDKEGDTLRINESEASIVRFIYSSYIQNHNISKVARQCEEQGYKGKHGATLRPAHIERILTAFVYCGYNSYCRVPHKGSHAAIIQAEDYNMVQQLMDQNIAGRKRARALVLLPTNGIEV